MQHGGTDKQHKFDPGYFYGETRWLSRAFRRNGYVGRNGAHTLKWYKRQFNKRLRRLWRETEKNDSQDRFEILG